MMTTSILALHAAFKHSMHDVPLEYEEQDQGYRNIVHDTGHQLAEQYILLYILEGDIYLYRQGCLEGTQEQCRHQVILPGPLEGKYGTDDGA